ncbi:MAG: SIMPL domain-containing protein [Acidobacteriaceae bacterium]
MKHALMLAGAAAWMCLSVACAQTIQVDKNNRTIAVTASDTATAEAELAGVSVGFNTYAPDAATAYSQGSQISNAIMDALKNAGVPDKSIESRAQNLSKTDFPYNPAPTPEERAQKAFTLSQSWTVHTSAADAARVLHAAVEAGANDSGAIDWDVTDRKGLEAKAAAKALVDAHAIAAQMAAGLGVTLGPLMYASNQAPERPVLPLARMGFQAKAAPPTVKPLALRPQQVEESATVYAVFSIE